MKNELDKEGEPTTVWIAGYNMPGYMPDNEPAECESFDEAKAHIIFMMKQFEDDCGDYTANKEVSGEDIAEEQEALATEYCHGAEEVNLQSGEFYGRFGDYVFWVTKDTK
jgi:hypothetical protein